MKSDILFWDKASVKYDKSALKTYTDAYRKTIKLSRKYLQKDFKMLDYGCGTGITTIELAKDVKSVKAIDISSGMIAEAIKKAETNAITNLNFKTAGILELDDENNTYDIITAFNILYFLENPETVISRIYDLLKPGGVFLSATDCIGEKTRIKTVLQKGLMRFNILPFFRMLTVKELESLICSSDFKIIKKKNLFDNPPNMFIAALK